MNVYEPNESINDDLKVRLTALALGEASEFERAQLESLMLERPELAAAYKQIQRLHASLAAMDLSHPDQHAADHDPSTVTRDTDWKLSSDRREKLLAVIRGEQPNPVQQPLQQPVYTTQLPDRSAYHLRRLKWWVVGVAAAACLLLCIILPLSNGTVSTARYSTTSKSASSAALSAVDETSAGFDTLDRSEVEYESYQKAEVQDSQSQLMKQLSDATAIPAAAPDMSDLKPESLAFGVPADPFPQSGPEMPRSGEMKGTTMHVYGGARDREVTGDRAAGNALAEAGEATNGRFGETGQMEAGQKAAEQSGQSDKWFLQGATKLGALGIYSDTAAAPPAAAMMNPSSNFALEDFVGPAQSLASEDRLRVTLSDPSPANGPMPAVSAVPGAIAGKAIEQSTSPAAMPRILVESEEKAQTGFDAKQNSSSWKDLSVERQATETELSLTEAARSSRNRGERNQQLQESLAKNKLAKIDELSLGELDDQGRVTDGLTEAAKKLSHSDSKDTDADVSMHRYRKNVQTLDESSAAVEPFSTFSLHVSDVSFKLAAAALAAGQWPDASKIRIEEFVNALDYFDPLPTSDERVTCQIEQAIHPSMLQRNVMRVSLRTAATGRSEQTPLRLTLLLDNSGSMERADRRQTVRRAFATLANQVQPNDQITLISFANTPRLLAERVSGSNLADLLPLVENLPSEGGTNLETALKLAMEKAAEGVTPENAAGLQNRIVLMTDGAVNLGDANPASLSQLVLKMRESGIAFDAAGISAQELNDSVLEALTRQGDGRYYLLDSAEEVSAGFSDQLAGALRPAAKNVKVQVEFNPDRVGHYKLLGFEKHLLNPEDFRNDKVDAAEMAAAEAGVAMYQFEADPDGRGDIGSVSVRFNDLATGAMIERRWPIPYQPSPPRIDQSSARLRLATVSALFAAKLRGDALGENVELKSLADVMTTLPAPFETAPRVQQLQSMIHTARQIGEPQN